MIIGFYNAANFITLAGLCSSLVSCYLALTGNYKTAVLMFLLAGACDMFDGRVARATDNGDIKRRTFGVQIDTVCDMVSFGIAPGIFAFSLGFRDIADVIIYIMFACFGAIRLAYFNTQALTEAENMKVTVFTGMPIPTICFFIPVLSLMMTFVDPNVMHWVFKAIYILVGVSFVINVKIKKPGLKMALFFLVAMLACMIALCFVGDIRVLI